MGNKGFLSGGRYYRPSGARCLIQRDEIKTKTASGLLIPEQAQEKPREATILAVGSDVREYAPGQRVLISPGKGTTPLACDTPNVYFVMESDIYCTIQ